MKSGRARTPLLGALVLLLLITLGEAQHSGRANELQESLERNHSSLESALREEFASYAERVDIQPDFSAWEFAKHRKRVIAFVPSRGLPRMSWTDLREGHPLGLYLVSDPLEHASSLTGSKNIFESPIPAGIYTVLGHWHPTPERRSPSTSVELVDATGETHLRAFGSMFGRNAARAAVHGMSLEDNRSRLHIGWGPHTFGFKANLSEPPADNRSALGKRLQQICRDHHGSVTETARAAARERGWRVDRYDVAVLATEGSTQFVIARPGLADTSWQDYTDGEVVGLAYVPGRLPESDPARRQIYRLRIHSLPEEDEYRAELVDRQGVVRYRSDARLDTYPHDWEPGGGLTPKISSREGFQVRLPWGPNLWEIDLAAGLESVDHPDRSGQE